MKLYTSYYTFFDTNLEFKTNYPLAYKEFNRIYGYFRCSLKKAEIFCSIEKFGNLFHVKALSNRYSLVYKINTEPHPDTYLSLFSPVIYEVKNYFLLHAGSLQTPEGESFIISAPCGFGKTTLTRALLKEGFNLLSDELAPVNAKTGLIYPYPRGMGVLTENNKEIIDIPKDKIGKPCNPGFVIFLTLEKEDQTNRYIELALARISQSIIRDFKKLSGVKQVTHVKGRLFPMLRFLLEKDAQIVTSIQKICDKNEIPIMYTLKGKTQPPDFNSTPKMEEMQAKDGIFELSQNILNAHNSALLKEVFFGSRPRMIFELAGLMDKAKFFTLTVGRLKEMVSLLCKIKN